MTEPITPPLAPRVDATPVVRTGAGTSEKFTVTVTNVTATASAFTVMVLGSDASWFPAPATTPVLQPNTAVTLSLELTPDIGTVPAKYPLVVTAQSTLPNSKPGLAEIELIVNPRTELNVEIAPIQVRAFKTKRFSVLLRNTGSVVAEVLLKPVTTAALKVHLPEEEFDVPPNSIVEVKGRATVTKPMWVGRSATHSLHVIAHGNEAERSATAEFVQNPFIAGFWVKALGVALVLALWLGLGAYFIPKLNNIVSTQNAISSGLGSATSAAATKVGTKTTKPKPSASANSGSGGSSGSSSGGGGSSAAGGGSSASAGSGAGSAGQTTQINGNVSATDPSGVTVTIKPTTLVDEQVLTSNATPVGFSQAVLTSYGKLAGQGIKLAPTDATPQSRSVTTGSDGQWGFAGVASPGYYLVTLTKPGYGTKSYVLDSTTIAAKDILTVPLVPGNGTLRGHIEQPDGSGLGGATVTITDGVNTFTVSTNTSGDVGSWQITGLSTPDTYTVSASKTGYSMESALVTLDAGNSQTQDIKLKRGEFSLSGRVMGARLTDGAICGLAGAAITATATDGRDFSSSVTAINDSTSNCPNDLDGTFALTNLPTGSYHITINNPGYGTVELDKTLDSSTAASGSLALGTVTLGDSGGTVQGCTEAVGVPAGLVNVGITLDKVNDDGTHTTYKTLSNAQPNPDTLSPDCTSGGLFRIYGVDPGDYTMSWTRAGYQSDSTSITIAATGTITPAPIQLTGVTGSSNPLPQTGAVCGTVKDPSNANVPGATVSIVIPTIAGVSGSTNARKTSTAPVSGCTGTYSLTGIVPGTYLARAWAPGYGVTTSTVNVAATGSTPMNFILAKTAQLVGYVESEGTVGSTAPLTATDGTTPTPACVVLINGENQIAPTNPTRLDCTNSTAFAGSDNPTAHGAFQLSGLDLDGTPVKHTFTCAPSTAAGVDLDPNYPYAVCVQPDATGKYVVNVPYATNYDNGGASSATDGLVFIRSVYATSNPEYVAGTSTNNSAASHGGTAATPVPGFTSLFCLRSTGCGSPAYSTQVGNTAHTSGNTATGTNDVWTADLALTHAPYVDLTNVKYLDGTGALVALPDGVEFDVQDASGNLVAGATGTSAGGTVHLRGLPFSWSNQSFTVVTHAGTTVGGTPLSWSSGTLPLTPGEDRVIDGAALIADVDAVALKVVDGAGNAVNNALVTMTVPVRSNSSGTITSDTVTATTDTNGCVLLGEYSALKAHGVNAYSTSDCASGGWNASIADVTQTFLANEYGMTPGTSTLNGTVNPKNVALIVDGDNLLGPDGESLFYQSATNSIMTTAFDIEVSDPSTAPRYQTVTTASFAATGLKYGASMTASATAQTVKARPVLFPSGIEVGVDEAAPGLDWSAVTFDLRSVDSSGDPLTSPDVAYDTTTANWYGSGYGLAASGTGGTRTLTWSNHAAGVTDHTAIPVGRYEVTASATGYQTLTAYLDCTLGDGTTAGTCAWEDDNGTGAGIWNGYGEPTLVQNGALRFRVATSEDATSFYSDGTYTLTASSHAITDSTTCSAAVTGFTWNAGTSACSWTASADGSDPTYSLNGAFSNLPATTSSDGHIIPPITYTVSATLPGLSSFPNTAEIECGSGTWSPLNTTVPVTPGSDLTCNIFPNTTVVTGNVQQLLVTQTWQDAPHTIDPSVDETLLVGADVYFCAGTATTAPTTCGSGTTGAVHGTTDGSGNFLLFPGTLASGVQFRISVSKLDYTTTGDIDLTPSTTGSIDVGGNAEIDTLLLRAPTVNYTFHIPNPLGSGNYTPGSGAHMTVSFQRGGNSSEITTVAYAADSDLATVPLIAGNYSYTYSDDASAGALIGATQTVNSSTFPVSPTTVTLLAPSLAFATVSGTVSANAPAGGLAGATVYLCADPASHTDNNCGTGAKGSTTDLSTGVNTVSAMITTSSADSGHEGEYAVANANVGTWQIWASASGYTTGRMAGTVVITKADLSAKTGKNLTLQRLRRTVALSLTPSDTTDDLSDATISVTPTGGSAYTTFTASYDNSAGVTKFTSGAALDAVDYDYSITLPTGHWATTSLTGSFTVDTVGSGTYDVPTVDVIEAEVKPLAPTPSYAALTTGTGHNAPTTSVSVNGTTLAAFTPNGTNAVWLPAGTWTFVPTVTSGDADWWTVGTSPTVTISATGSVTSPLSAITLTQKTTAVSIMAANATAVTASATIGSAVTIVVTGSSPFALALPYGTWTLTVTPAEGYMAGNPVVLTTTTATNYVGTSPDSPVTITQNAWTATYSGTLPSNYGASTTITAMCNATFDATNNCGTTPSAAIVSSADGTWSIDLPYGKWDLTAVRTGYTGTTLTTTTLTNASHANSTGHTTPTLTPWTAMLKVTVTGGTASSVKAVNGGTTVPLTNSAGTWTGTITYGGTWDIQVTPATGTAADPADIVTATELTGDGITINRTSAIS